jgi:kynurenine 3-monooxygenase
MTEVAQSLLSRFRPDASGVPTKALKIAIVGAGPAGLLLAWKLLKMGHRVDVFEKRPEYKLSEQSDSRSYNLTADGLGLRAFSELGNLIHCAGVIVDGRAIHSQSGSLWTHPYGHRATDYLVSIPRGDLLALLAATLVGHPNCTLRFNSEVTAADVKEGVINWKGSSTAAPLELSQLDLIAFADGVHGIGQRKAKEQPGVNSANETEDTPYLNVTISKNAAKRAKLHLNKIHFFPAEDSLGIGLPNFDGTISLLIEGRALRNSKQEVVCPFTGKVPFSFYKNVFGTRREADAYLRNQHSEYEQILADVPDDQLVLTRPGHFTESFITSWRVGRLGILVGDAGSCAPPWAGFGMNLACSHAADLAELIAQSNDIEIILEKYNKRRQKCTQVVRRIIREHGALLNSGIGSGRWRREQAVRERREELLGERSEYQIVAFQERGLEELAGLD